MIHFSSFCLDGMNQCVWNSAEDGRKHRVTLTPRAFDLLQYLVDHAGQLVTHDALLDALWPGVYVQSEVLKTHVLQIRTALGDDPRSPSFIETQRGRGYRFIAPLRPTKPVDMPQVSEREYCAFDERTPQHRLLNALFQEACRGAIRIAFVTGESGIGKTRFVTKFLKTLTDDPTVSTSLGQCIENYGGVENYYPVMEALAQLLRGTAGSLIARTLISTAPTWAFHMSGSIPEVYRRDLPHQIDNTASNRMLREICEFLRELSTQRPIVIALENLHWADYFTVDFLSALARQQGSARLLIVATYCEEEAAMATHPIRAINMDLRSRGLCRNIPLNPLTESEIADYLSAQRVPESLDNVAGLARFLHERTGGNPVFMTATLHQLIELGTIRLTSYGWNFDLLPSDTRLDIPETLHQVIEQHIRRLSEIQQRVLEVASVAGTTFSARTAAPAADMSQLEFEDVCENLCAQQSFIQRAPSATSNHTADTRSYVFHHSIYRQALYERQGSLRLEHLHIRLLEAMERFTSHDQPGNISLDRGIQLRQIHYS